MTVPTGPVAGVNTRVGARTVSVAVALCELASVADTVCEPAVFVGTVSDTEKLPLASVVAPVTEDPPIVIVTADDAAKPVPATVTEPPILWLPGVTVIA